VSQPAPKLQISRVELHGIYVQGEEAVMALVEGLLERIGQLEERNELPRRKRTGYQNQKRASCSSLCNLR